MTFYHESKDAALLAAAVYAEHFTTRAELEPNNGWVIVLVPKSIQVFEWPLAPILEYAEIELIGINRLALRPREHVPIAKLPEKGAKKSADGKVVRPAGGVTARIHTIGDKLKADGVLNSRADRPAFWAACEAEGIGKGTFGVQAGKWYKLNGM